MTNLWELSVGDLRGILAQSEATPAEAIRSCLSRVDEVEHLVHAWAYLERELAIQQCDGPARGTLWGIPMGVKDIFNTRDMPTGMGSAVWANFTPGNDARVVFSAREAGSIIFGKTVTAEFAVHAPGPTRNPRDVRHSPGTSSSGSAAAVACGMVPWSLGSQTAGSIVRPAAYCGVYGFKPSYGLIARTGMLKTTDTLDQIGFFHRDPLDARLLLESLRLRGKDYPLIYANLDKGESGPQRRLRIGVITSSLRIWEHTAPETRNLIKEVVERLVALGIDVTELSLPGSFNEAHEIHETIYDRCIAYYFERESKQGHLVSAQITGMVERGRGISITAYANALERQAALQRQFGRVSEPYDAILSPAVAGAAPVVDEAELDDAALIWSLIGAPVAVVPFFVDNQLPLALQLVSRRYGDHQLLDVLERMTEAGIARAAPIAEPATV